MVFRGLLSTLDHTRRFPSLVYVHIFTRHVTPMILLTVMYIDNVCVVITWPAMCAAVCLNTADHRSVSALLTCRKSRNTGHVLQQITAWIPQITSGRLAKTSMSTVLHHLLVSRKSVCCNCYCVLFRCHCSQCVVTRAAHFGKFANWITEPTNRFATS